MNTQGIIGHKAQLRRLGMLIDTKTIPQTLLFTGMPGIGKKLIAMRFLNTLACREENPPCLACPACRQVQAGSFPDLLALEPDEKGKIPIGAQERDEPGSVRWLIGRLQKRPVSGTYGVLINGVETISLSGQNALLKTIEEPQPGTHIVMIASNKAQILTTIISRSAEIPFQPLSSAEVQEAVSRLVPGGISLPIAEMSGGSAERAMLLSDSEMRESILGLCRDISGHLRSGKGFDYDIARFGKKPGYEPLLDILINVYRHALVASVRGTDPGAEMGDISLDDWKKSAELIKIFLALKKGLLNNLNIKIALKGMLYSIDEMKGIGIPDVGV